jgi:hypothetical protein
VGEDFPEKEVSMSDDPKKFFVPVPHDSLAISQRLADEMKREVREKLLQSVWVPFLEVQDMTGPKGKVSFSGPCS